MGNSGSSYFLSSFTDHDGDVIVGLSVIVNGRKDLLVRGLLGEEDMAGSFARSAVIRFFPPVVEEAVDTAHQKQPQRKEA